MRITAKTVLALVAGSFVVLAARVASAQVDGCVDSPEDPTVVLGMLGLGAAAVPMVWARIKSFRNKK
jgi:hypothetical protein